MIFAHSSAHSSPESTRVNLSQSESSCRYSRWSWPTGSPSTMKTRMVSCNWRQVGIGRYREHGLHDERNWWLAAVLSTHVHTTSAQVFQFCTARTTHGWLLIISYPWPLQMRSTQGSSKNDSLDWILDHTKVVGYSIQLLRIPMNLEDQWRPSVQSLLKTRWRLFINALRMSFLDKFICLI